MAKIKTQARSRAAPTQKKIKKTQPPLLSTAFPIVGIGASAGGLEAFMELFRNLPSDTGLAYILIQHLSPHHLSMLSSIVQKTTRMQVQEIIDGMKVVPNQVYVIPPDALLEIFHGVLHLSPAPTPHASSMPVDTFLRSLALDQGNLAIGMILSGTGSDGSRGLKDIKAEGGITFVQEPTDAKYNGMPLAAIGGATPDHVLSVDRLALELIKISKRPFVKKTILNEDHEPTPETKIVLEKIFILVRNTTKIDFSTYKYPTLMRRIKRRMVLHRIETFAQYLTYLHATPNEVTSLFDDLLINVTDFFRDGDAFEALKSSAFPELLKNRPVGTPIRIWVPGCSTGEEVYSIAISLLEFLGDGVNKFPIQIYGTDICEPAIKIARTGVYPEGAAKNLTPSQIQKFFKKETGGGYRIARAVRDCCIFSIQDVTSQPPINRLDLLSCRNLMIYLGTPIQKKLMETFYYALNPRGYLLLGASETVGTAADLFAIHDKKNKIYTKKSVAHLPTRDFQVHTQKISAAELATPIAEPPLKRPIKLQPDPVAEAELLILEKYAPAWVLVNQNLDIIQFRGPTGNYIEPASGQPTWNLIRMLREGLATDVRMLVHSAIKGGAAIRKDSLKVKAFGTEHWVDIEATPVSQNHCLVIFIERTISKTSVSTQKPSGKAKKLALTTQDKEIAVLRDELTVTQNSLQSIIEDQDATNEEMQSANEEVLSANEELQSTNEELETAKEELQSTNEELTSLNDELSSRNRDLDHLNNDLLNVLSNANVSIVMVGPDLRIRRFTPMAEKLLKLIATDVGRNLTDINLGFQIDKLEEKIADVINNMSTVEIETQDRRNQWYSIRIRPYKTSDHRIDGAVIVFVNIDDVKQREKAVVETKTYSDGIIQTVRDPLIVLDSELRVERANQAFFDIFRLKSKDTLGKLFYRIGNGHWNSPELRKLLEDVLPKKKEVRDFKVIKKFPILGQKVLLLNARALEWEGQIKLLILISLHDLTSSKLASRDSKAGAPKLRQKKR